MMGTMGRPVSTWEKDKLDREECDRFGQHLVAHGLLDPAILPEMRVALYGLPRPFAPQAVFTVLASFSLHQNDPRRALPAYFYGSVQEQQLRLFGKPRKS